MTIRFKFWRGDKLVDEMDYSAPWRRIAYWWHRIGIAKEFAHYNGTRFTVELVRRTR